MVELNMAGLFGDILDGFRGFTDSVGDLFNNAEAGLADFIGKDIDLGKAFSNAASTIESGSKSEKDVLETDDLEQFKIEEVKRSSANVDPGKASVDYQDFLNRWIQTTREYSQIDLKD